MADAEDGTFADFAEALKSYQATTPEELVKHALLQAGIRLSDDEDAALVQRLVALAADHFIAEVINDSVQYQRIRAGIPKAGEQQTETILTLEDAQRGLANVGVEIRSMEAGDEA